MYPNADQSLGSEESLFVEREPVPSGGSTSRTRILFASWSIEESSRGGIALSTIPFDPLPWPRITRAVVGVKVTVVRTPKWSCARKRAAAAAAVGVAAVAAAVVDAAAVGAAVGAAVDAAADDAAAAASSGCKRRRGLYDYFCSVDNDPTGVSRTVGVHR
ncbi:hypothetical protein KM043_015164 [Ampulex compressa]|nr:hypothetical protein KM043_015164 [Ampulex compressa]